jgi:hypothetical protein
MGQTSRDLGELLRRSLATAVASIEVGEDGLDIIWLRLARARSSPVAHDRETVVRPVAHLSCGRLQPAVRAQQRA